MGGLDDKIEWLRKNIVSVPTPKSKYKKDRTIDDILKYPHKFKNIELKYLKDFEYQSRRTYNKESIKRLALNIKEVGLIHPVLVLEYNPKKYVIISGHRRVRAIKNLGYKQIECKVYKSDKLNLADRIKLHLSENSYNQVPPYEEADMIHYFWNMLQKERDGKLTKKEFCRLINRSPETVNYALRFIVLDKEIKKSVIKKDIPYRGGCYISKIPDKDVRLKYKNYLCSLNKKSVTFNYIKTQIDSYLKSLENPSLFDMEYIIKQTFTKSLKHKVADDVYWQLVRQNKYLQRTIDVTEEMKREGVKNGLWPINDPKVYDQYKRNKKLMKKWEKLAIKKYYTN